LRHPGFEQDGQHEDGNRVDDGIHGNWRDSGGSR
jgi:hypothetical protein